MLSELFAIFLLGMVNGLTVCSFSCMPVLGSYLMATGDGFQDGIVSVLSFVVGKTLSYTVLGGTAALLGTIFIEGGLPHIRLISGGLLIAAGLSLPLLRTMSCSHGGGCKIKKISLFTLGLSSGFIPCPSLTAVFIIAASKADILHGAACGIVYGLGLAISPLLLLGGIISRISQSIKKEAGHFMPAIQVVSVVILVGLGFRLIFQEV